MEKEFTTDQKYIMDLEMLNIYNAKGCAACNQKFTLGDTVVLAIGGWPDNCAKLIHEKDAVFDKKTNSYYDKTYFFSKR